MSATSAGVLIEADTAAAIVELRLAYAWLVKPVSQGGLGYTTKKAKASHVYAALLALGGGV